MKRRNFVTTALAGLAALPFVGKTTEASVAPSKAVKDDCTCSLVHRESYSARRCTDARIISGCAKHDRNTWLEHVNSLIAHGHSPAEVRRYNPAQIRRFKQQIDRFK